MIRALQVISDVGGLISAVVVVWLVVLIIRIAREVS